MERSPLRMTLVRHCGLVIFAAAALLGLLPGRQNATHVPFGTAEIALVHLATALLWGVTFVRAFPVHRRSLVQLAQFVLIILAIGVIVAGRSLDESDLEIAVALPVRLGVALLFGLAAATVIMSLTVKMWGRPQLTSPQLTSLWSSSLWSSSLPFLFVALVVPTVHLQAVCDRWNQQATALLSENRLGEALDVLTRLTLFGPDVLVNGRSATDSRQAVAAECAALSRECASPIPANATANTRLQRAQTLAMLQRPSEAIDMVVPLIQSADPDPRAFGLLATIAQNEQVWDESRQWFERALVAWSHKPPGAERCAGEHAGYLGVAFAERKLGHLREAEQAYAAALALRPDAATHFLLARFYSDSQMASKAAEHANQAHTLDPAHYALPTQELIGELQSRDFGCFTVWRGRQQ